LAEYKNSRGCWTGESIACGAQRVFAGVDPYHARRALDKAEQSCLVSNSLKATMHLETDVAVAAAEAISA
jgi:uncharacterized OsmC-like protein